MKSAKLFEMTFTSAPLRFLSHWTPVCVTDVTEEVSVYALHLEYLSPCSAPIMQ